MTTAPDPGLSARRLERWKLSLLDLTLRNRLLDAKDGRQVVTLAGVDPVKLAAALAGGVELELTSYTPPAAEAVGGGERVVEAIAHAAGEALAARKLLVAAPALEVERRLVTMSRAARESLREGGARTLWLALGVLRWFEPGEDVARHAPLLLVPAELKRIPGSDRFKVAAVADEEPRWNETLLEKLRSEHRLEVPRPDDDEPEVAAVMGAVTSAVDVKPGWQVLPEARLGIFSFTKFAMWTDLAQRGHALLAAPVVQHLAGSDGRAFPDQGPFLDPGELDRTVALGELFAPLDADASQLVAVMAGAAGRSFVLQGPPGTGKSQTITNLIAQALATGKTVLFVAEKIAALEVVERRLQAVGLGDFCLELHSHKAKKREVIGELGRVLERVWRPNTPVAGDDVRLAAVRAELDEYADALHRSQPAGTSVHDALARLGELRDAPRLGAAAATASVSGPEDVATRREAVTRLAQAGVEVTPPTAHPWRGSTLEEWKLTSEDAVATAVGEARAAGAALAAAVATLPSVVPGLDPRTRAELEAAGALADKLASSPRPGAELIMDVRTAGATTGAEAAKVALIKARAGGQAAPKDVGAWLALERHRREHAARLEERWTTAVYEPALTGLADTFRTWAERFPLFRWFALRGPRGRVKRALASGTLPADAAIAADLDRARELATVDGVLAGARPAVKRWLGALSAAAEPGAALDPVEEAEAWARELRAAFDQVGVAAAAREQAWRAVVAIASDPAGAGATMADLGAAVARWRAARTALTATCGVDVDDGPDGRHLPALATATAAWATAPGALRAWTAYARARKAALAAGLGPLVERFEAGELAPEQLAPAWERAMLIGVADAGLAASPVLAGFHGSAHHARVAELGELDRAQLGVARARAIARLSERVPRVVPGQDVADTGEIGLLLHELKKQRRHKPLRTLFREIPTLLTRLKPCLLMSPLSVAQYLDPAIDRFDLVIFDEASQIPTADAIGALARGQAAVIVGDSKQLPPTRFFAVGDGRDADGVPDAEDDVEELESVLDECVAARLPELRLRWHYRSRHEDLIAFSNDRYYGGNLDVFPAAAARVAELGVSLRRVPGVYDRAGARHNRTEAEAVVAEVKARLMDPVESKRSLAVVTFSRPQQELILDLLDEERQRHPELEPFFADDAAGASAAAGGKGGAAVPEPVMVKNLETIQGDERDVVLFSIGYGPDRDGKVTMNFGPLGKDGGERRLNVAVTRAREQLVLFSSIDPEQIREDVTAAGVTHLRELLAYARDGGRPEAEAAARPPATRLTAAIGAALTAKGWTVHHQVGCAGYRLDLAVVDPDEPGRYVLAIEADGPAYASARTARDRDRLRALVLGNLGWKLHRIWSLDWWHDGDKELQRANNAVINAVAKARAGRKPAGAARSGPVLAPVASPSVVPSSAPARAAAGSGPNQRTAPVLTPAARVAAAVPTTPLPVNDAPTSPTPVADLPTEPTMAPVGLVGAAVGAGGVPSAGALRPVRSTRPPVRIDGPIAPKPTQPASPVVRVTKPTLPSVGGPQVQPYQAASLPAGRRTPDDLHDPSRTEEVGKAIAAVLAVEAPISLALLSRRVGAYFGVGRVTDKVEGRVREVAAQRAQFGAGDDADVVWRKDQDPAGLPLVRVPGTASETRRDASEVPVAEIAAASLVVLSRNLGMGSTDLQKETAKLLGFARYTDKVQARMKDGLDALLARGACQLDGSHVSLP